MEGKRKWEVWESKKNRKKMRNRERLDWECRKIESLWESEGEREREIGWESERDTQRQFKKGKVRSHTKKS